MKFCGAHSDSSMMAEWKFCPMCGGVLTNDSNGVAEPGLFDEVQIPRIKEKSNHFAPLEQIVLSNN